MKRRLPFGILLSAVALLIAGCGDSASSGSTGRNSSEGKVSVVATTPILGDFVRNVGGDRVEVYDIVKPNVDLHDYEPTPRDMTALADAKLIVQNGVGLEAWFEESIETAGSKGAVVDASKGVAIRTNEDGADDPHIWHNVDNAKMMVSNIASALATADSAGAAVYSANRQTYDNKLDELKTNISAQIKTLTNKKLVTNHDALGYYVEAFGLTYVGAIIPSFDSEAELSSVQISELVAQIKAEKVKAIFSESTLPSDTAATIAREAKVKIVQGQDALYGDSLGEAGSGAATYLEMEAHNTNAIVANLR
jgi:ABC-type Zn uptake system ZnuABC Zn-binding protein ZnuA